MLTLMMYAQFHQICNALACRQFTHDHHHHHKNKIIIIKFIIINYYDL